MSVSIKSIKNLTIPSLVDRFGKRAIEKDIVVDGQIYNAVLVNPVNKSANKSPDVYLFKNDEFVSRTADRTTNKDFKSIITEATDRGYKTTSILTSDDIVTQNVIDTIFTTLGEFRKKGFWGKISERLRGFVYNNNLPVKIKTINTSVSPISGEHCTELSSDFNIISKGKNSKFVINGEEDGYINVVALKTNEYGDTANFNFMDYPRKVNIEDAPSYLDYALKALKKFD